MPSNGTTANDVILDFDTHFQVHIFQVAISTSQQGENTYTTIAVR